MTTGNHDTLVYRLAQILIKLNQGEKLDPLTLADEFGVNLRTIQRDLNVRFTYLPLQKSDGRYHLDPAYLGKLSTRDIERFASLAGVRGLFPTLSDDFLGDIFDSRMQSAFLVKGHNWGPQLLDGCCQSRVPCWLWTARRIEKPSPRLLCSLPGVVQNLTLVHSYSCSRKVQHPEMKHAEIFRRHDHERNTK